MKHTLEQDNKTAGLIGSSAGNHEDDLLILSKAFDFLEENASRFIKDTPENQSFIANPDASIEHKPEWHQFGIITHTRRFADHFESTMQQYLKEWEIDQKINAYLDEKIDGISKKNLLRLSIPFHDVGKLAGRYFKMKDGKPVAHYNGHEKLSEELIRRDGLIRQFLTSIGLTDPQIDYVATCAGLHYELGKIRDIPRKTGNGFTIAFAQSQQCKDYCLACMEEHPGFKVEMGVLYLCDSLAKTDIILDVSTDEEIVAKSDDVARMVANLNLHPNLSSAIKQLPVNIVFVRTYMTLIP